MSVSVIGENYDNVDGLALSLAVHRKAHRENGDAILNLEDAKRARAAGASYVPRKEDARPVYVRLPYPKHLYHADGRDRVVADEPAHLEAKKEGFREDPFPKARVAVKDPEEEKALLQKRLAESDGKVTLLNESLLKLQEQVAALTPDPDAKKSGKGKKSDNEA